jgi:hypothetical protein
LPIGPFEKGTTGRPKFVEMPLGGKSSPPWDIEKIHPPTKHSNLTKNDPEKAPSPVFVFCFFFRVVRVFRGEKCFAFGFPFA